MKQIWSVLCLRSIIDHETNNISLVDCLEQINIQVNKSANAPKSKNFPIIFDFVSLFSDKNTGKERKFDFILETIGLGGEKISEIAGQFAMQKGVERLRNRIKIQGLKITDSGEYLFRLKYREAGKKEFKEAAELPLDVKVSYKLM